MYELMRKFKGFYINLVIGAVSLPVLLILTPSFQPRQEGISRSVAIRNVDLLGSALSVVALVTGIMAISFGGTKYAWQSPLSRILAATAPSPLDLFSSAAFPHSLLLAQRFIFDIRDPR
jgi:hypothetical protein